MSRTIPFLLALALFGCNKTDPNETETSTDTDSAVDTDVLQDDQDGDTILDVHEGSNDEVNTDGDKKPDYTDKDSDGDGVRDIVEAGDDDPMTLPVDSDGDGVPDFQDVDSDNNGISDEIESGRDDGGAVDTDGDGIKDIADADNDGDGINDTVEMGVAAESADTDGDGTKDYMDVDSDNDGIGDKFEGGTSLFEKDPKDSDGDGVPDYQDTDSDNDGTADRDESGVTDVGTEPRDTDGDGKYDFQDTDADGDGLSDNDEIKKFKTDPYDFDSDGDGFSDGGEVLAETDPLDSESVIDGVYVVVGERTEVEQDFDFELRVERGDVAMSTDTTCSMGGTITAVKAAFTTILSDITATFPDVAGGAGYVDDYAYGSMGSPGSDKPFHVLTPVTTDATKVQDGVNKLSTHSGADGPESGMEGSYQSAAGTGYDQDCDGSYDTLTDVVPFLADPSDPFGGGGGEFYDATLPDNGMRGGYGYRDYSLPLVVYVQDNYMRDPEASGVSWSATPGGCPKDAGYSDVVAAFTDLGGYIMYVDAGSGLNYAQTMALTTDIGSIADMDGDGEVDDNLVTKLSQSSPTYKEDLSAFVVLAVEQLVARITFSSVSLTVDGDEWGFVTNIDPESYPDIDPDAAAELSFTLTFRGTVAATTEDQLFHLSLNIVGDGTTLVGTRDIIVVVPGTEF